MVLEDGLDAKIEVDMWPLPPRYLTQTDRDEVWLLPLVDLRYYWQGAGATFSVGQWFTGFGGLWTDYFAGLDAGLINATPANYRILSVTFDSPHTDYLKPDSPNILKYNQSLTMLWDVMAHSTGQRAIMPLDQTSFELLNWTSSDSRYQANKKGLDDLLAGGDFSDRFADGAKAGNVTVAFHEILDGPPLEFDYSKKYTNTADSLGYGPSGAGELVYFDTCLADNRNNAHDTTPRNDTRLDNLAKRIGHDYYLSQKYHYDYTFAGLTDDWQLSGYDDALWFHVGNQFPDAKGGGYGCFTRIWSMPPGFRVETQFHYDDAYVYAPWSQNFLGKVTQDDLNGLDDGEVGEVTIDTPFNFPANPFEVQAKNATGYHLVDGEPVWVRRFTDIDAEWRVEQVTPGGKYQLSSNLTSGGSASANRLRWTGSSWVAVATSETVYDEIGTMAAVSGAIVLCKYDAQAAKLIVWQVQC